MQSAHKMMRKGGGALRLRISQFYPIFLLLLLFLLADGAAEVSAVVAERIRFCLCTLIPSLFGCMAAANLLRESGAGRQLGFRLRNAAHLLRFPAECMGIFAVSQLAGYPVGAMLLKREAEAGNLSAGDAARLSAVCCGGGPAFFVGFAGTELFGSPAAGWVLLSACVLANCAAAFLLRQNGKPVTAAECPACRLSPAALTGAVSDAVRSLTQICGIVMFFGVMTWLCGRLGLLRLMTAAGAYCGIREQTVSALFTALLDVTQLRGLLICGLPFSVLLPLTAGLLSFGGICVQLQCLALGVPEMSAVRLLLTRLMTAVIAALLTAAVLPFISVPEAAAVFAHGTAVSRTGSAIPALLILCTGFPLLIYGDTSSTD